MDEEKKTEEIIKNETQSSKELEQIETNEMAEKVKTEGKIEEKTNTVNIEKEQIKNNKKEKKQKEKKNKRVAITIITTILVCLGLLFSVIFSLLNIHNTKIMSGISVLGIDISNLSPEEALNKLNKAIEDKFSEEITLKYNDYETTININEFETNFNVEEVINKAYSIGRDGNIITNNYSILFTQLLKKNFMPELQINEELLINKLNDIASKLPGAVVQSSYYIENENLIIVRGKSGVLLKQDELREQILKEIKNIKQKNNIILITAETVSPDEIDLEKIRNEIYKDPKDAYVEKEPTIVHPHVNGIDFKISIEEAKELLKQDKNEYTIPLKITIPKKTIKDLGTEAFPDLLATYTTRYDASNYNRSTNLELASAKINGTVIMPGEIFSYNQVVGERTISAGYKEAAAYAGGEVIQSVGGGICQISSTLYNSVLLANLEIVDRSNHQFSTGYVPDSRDATVSWGTLDFQFKNSRKFPIKIVSNTDSGVCKIDIYGIKEETEYEVVIQSKVTAYIPNSVKYIEDSTLEEGKEVVEQVGHNGNKSEAYRILKLNGEVISKTLLSKDTYDPLQRIIRIGTKKKETTTNNKATSSSKQENTTTSSSKQENITE